MMGWFRKKNRIEVLESQYSSLMRKSFETSLKDKEKSESLQRQAQNLFQEINYISLQQGNK